MPAHPRIRRGGLVAAVALLFIALSSLAPAATLIQFAGYNVEVEDTIGSGSNSAVIVMDWSSSGDSWASPSHAWEVRWNGNALSTLGEALDLIAAATAASPVSFSYPVGSVGIDANFKVTHAGETHVGDGEFWASTWASVRLSEPDPDYPPASGTNAAGIYFETLNSGFTGTPLVDQVWYGLNPDVRAPGATLGDWPGLIPSVNATPIPEPGAAALALLGLTTLRRRRR